MTSTWAARAAGTWSLAYAGAALYWALGGGGYPFADSGRARSMGAVLVDLDPVAAGTTIGVLGLAGVVVAAAMTRPHAGHRRSLLGFAWIAALALILLVPDGRVLLSVGELFLLNIDRLEGAVVNQAFCALGGTLWIAAALELRRRTGRRNLGALRWGRAATYLAVALPLLYAVPRWLWALGLTFGIDQETAAAVTSPEGRTRELVFGAVACGGALLTLGLVQRWGETFPRPIPFLGGRRVPILLATVPAGLVSIVLIGAGFTLCRTLLAVLVGAQPGDAAAFDSGDWAAWLGNLAWLPWGIALGAATLAYRRRRHRARARSGHHRRQAAQET